MRSKARNSVNPCTAYPMMRGFVFYSMLQYLIYLTLSCRFHIMNENEALFVIMNDSITTDEIIGHGAANLAKARACGTDTVIVSMKTSSNAPHGFLQVQRSSLWAVWGCHMGQQRSGVLQLFDQSNTGHMISVCP